MKSCTDSVFEPTVQPEIVIDFRHSFHSGENIGSTRVRKNKNLLLARPDQRTNVKRFGTFYKIRHSRPRMDNRVVRAVRRERADAQQTRFAGARSEHEFRLDAYRESGRVVNARRIDVGTRT